ncbi:BZIP domain-containing protein [Pseudoscourfieldia marina]
MNSNGTAAGPMSATPMWVDGRLAHYGLPYYAYAANTNAGSAQSLQVAPPHYLTMMTTNAHYGVAHAQHTGAQQNHAANGSSAATNGGGGGGGGGNDTPQGGESLSDAQVGEIRMWALRAKLKHSVRQAVTAVRAEAAAEAEQLRSRVALLEAQVATLTATVERITASETAVDASATTAKGVEKASAPENAHAENSS